MTPLMTINALLLPIDRNPFFELPKRKIGPIRAPLLAWLFLVFALPTILFLAVAMAPFQVTDEHNHALRADQVSRGTLISPRIGDHVDGAIYTFGRLHDYLSFHYDAKETGDVAKASAALRWAVPDQWENFQNTAQYGPALYAPQAIGIWIGKLLGLNPAWTILCSRLVNGLIAASIGFIAICFCRRGQAMTFTALLLPMTTSEFASLSQDALIISLSILAVALASGVIAEQRPARVSEFFLFVVIVVATTMARPSQVALAPLGLAFVGWPDKAWRRKSLIAVLGFVCIAIWISILPKLMPEEPPGASVSGQLKAMIESPLLLPKVLVNSFRESGWWLFETMAGRLGWLDLPLPPWYYIVASGILICAWLAPGNRPPYAFPALVGVITPLALLLAIGVALYTSWTPMGKMTVDGLQGRYMLPVLPLLAWSAPAWRGSFATPLMLAWAPVLVFPLVSLTVLPGAVMARYYGSWSDMGSVLKILFFS
jgi:hypothetical protein